MSACLMAGAMAIALGPGNGFSLAWTHSVEKTEWREDWRVTDAGLVPIRAAVKGSGAGMEPGPEGSLQKLVSVRSRQKLSELAMDLQGNLSLHFDPHAYVKEDWGASWLNAPTGRIAGGSDEVLLNTIAERILGLPQDHRPDKGVPFNQIPA